MTQALPTSIEALEREQQQLRDERAQIETQLAQRKAEVQAFKATSGFLTPEKWAEFISWKAKATSALRHKTARLQAINKALLDARVAISLTAGMDDSGPIDAKDPVSLLRASFGLLCRLRKEGVDFAAQEIAVIAACEHYFHHVGSARAASGAA